MDFLLLIIGLFILIFGFVIAFGAPYLPTLKIQTDQALDLLDLKAGQTLLELGCGDGRVLRAAAARGINGVGYELNPILVLVARLVTWRYRKQIKIVWGNYWQSNWPPTDGIFVFLLDKYMEKLDKKVVQKYSGQHVKLVSYTFKIPGKKVTRQLGALYLYDY